MCVEADGFDTTGKGFDQGGGIVRDGLGEGKHEVFGDDAIFGKTTILHTANGFAVGAKEVFTFLTIWAMTTRAVGGGHDGDAVAEFDVLDVCAYFDNIT